jgi:hypothetical protein
MATDQRTPFVPDGFVPPAGLAGDDFLLEPLGPQHNDSDYDAWTSSMEHIRATPGYPDGSWPKPMTLAQNRGDLERHQRDYQQRRGFTYTVLDPGSRSVIGCVYIYPSKQPLHDAEVLLWVRATHAQLDEPLWLAVREWLDRDGFPFWAFWENIRSWWEIRHLPNVMIVHFAELKRDMGGKMREIADFLGVPVAPETWPEIEQLCSFEWMKANADQVTPLGGAIFEGGGATFINKGVNGRWQEVLPAVDSAAYEAKATAELGEECAAWLGQR